jgi:hypothetical protein
MVNNDRPGTGQSSANYSYADLEARLIKAVSDFGFEELNQMLDVAEAIRRTRRV